MTRHVKEPFVDLIDMEYRYEALDKINPPAIQEGNKNNWKKRKFNGKGSWLGKPKGGPQDNRFKNVTCYNCQQKGHLSTHYRNPITQGTQGSTPRSCFYCHQSGRMVKDCPLMKKGEQSIVYAIKDEPSISQVVKGKGVLEGNIFIKDVLVRLLFDTRDSHSFIAKKYIEGLELKPNIVDGPIRITNPIGCSTNPCMHCEKVPFPIIPITFLLIFSS